MTELRQKIQEIKRLLFILFMSSVFSIKIFAGLADFTQKVRDLGFIANSSSPGIVNSQKAGYATLGGFSIRSPIASTKIANLQLPSIRAGCGGIDLFAGSFSFITMEQFAQTAKAIAQGTLGYAVKLGIDTLSPQMHNIMSEIEEAQRMINSMNINSCQMAASIVAGLAPKTQASTELACQSRAMGSGNFVSDAFTAKYECSQDENKEKDARNKDSGMESVLDGEFNLVYDALVKSNITDQEMISLMMSITGTITNVKESDKLKSHFYKSLALGAVRDEGGAQRRSIIDGFLNGGTVGIYKCKDHDARKCFNVEEMSDNVSEGLVTKIAGIIDKINAALIKSSNGDTELLDDFEDEQIKLISMSKVPVLDLLIKDLASGSAVTKNFTELIALDVALGYTEEIISKVRASVIDLERVNFNGDLFKDFREELNAVEAKLRSEKILAANKLQGITSLIKFANSETENMYQAISLKAN